jgi:hypothetical protein
VVLAFYDSTHSRTHNLRLRRSASTSRFGRAAGGRGGDIEVHQRGMPQLTRWDDEVARSARAKRKRKALL